VLLGVGGLALGLMAAGLGLGARTDAQLRDARRADPGRDIDGWLADGLVGRGQAANRLAIAGSVLAGVTLVAGATCSSSASPAAARAALRPAPPASI